MRQLFVRAVATAVLAVATGAVASPLTPAHAADCGDGVTVVVDYHQLGGGVRQVCDAGGAGKTAAALFEANGFALTYVQRQPGFVCRINGKPATDPCVNTPPANAYWSLFWSNGEADWSYASQGAGSLTLGAGDWVGFSWQGSAAKSPPGVSPKGQASATPTPSPSSSGHHRGPTRQASPSPSPSPSASAPSSAGDSASPSPAPRKHRSRSAASSATAAAAASSTPSASTSAADQVVDPAAPPGRDGLPVWVIPTVVLLVLGAAGAVGVARRRGMHAS